jgi:hypothetical protein
VIDRLTSKRTVLVLVTSAASVILVSGSREWVSGSTSDVVLGVSALHGSGSEVAPAALAAALVGLASAVAAATAGSVVRVIAACSAVMAAVLGAAVVISVVVDPSGALGRRAVAGTGRTGTVAASGHVGGWAWVALAAMLIMGIGGLSALAGRRRWHGLSSRYDAAAEAGGPAASASAWDQLSRGEDPTAGH